MKCVFMCYVVSSDVSVCNTVVECVLVCQYCAVLVLQYISTWSGLQRNGSHENSPRVCQCYI